MTFLTAIPGALKLVPRWLWYALAAALLWHFALSWHRGQVKTRDVQIVAARDAQWRLRFDAMRAQANAYKAAAENQARAISSLQRKLNDEETRRIAAAADDLRLRGPGKATAPANCRPVDHPVAAAGAGRSEPAGRPGQAAPAAVPAGDGESGFAIVPWDWLVDVVEQGDANRAEALTWREADGQQRAAWERLRSQAQKQSPTKEGPPNGR